VGFVTQLRLSCRQSDLEVLKTTSRKPAASLDLQIVVGVRFRIEEQSKTVHVSTATRFERRGARRRRRPQIMPTRPESSTEADPSLTSHSFGCLLETALIDPVRVKLPSSLSS